MDMKLIYAGIGSRQTPLFIQTCMTSAAYQMSQHGWFLRSGYAIGADQAFGLGAARHSEETNIDRWEMVLPWEGYNKAPSNDPRFITGTPSKQLLEIARECHPVWDKLSDPVKLLLCRNVQIIAGKELDDPVQLVIGWTQRASGEGGTGHAFRVASLLKIPYFDLASQEGQIKASEFVYDAETAFYDLPW